MHFLSSRSWCYLESQTSLSAAERRTWYFWICQDHWRVGWGKRDWPPEFWETCLDRGILFHSYTSKLNCYCVVTWKWFGNTPWCLANCTDNQARGDNHFSISSQSVIHNKGSGFIPGRTVSMYRRDLSNEIQLWRRKQRRPSPSVMVLPNSTPPHQKGNRMKMKGPRRHSLKEASMSFQPGLIRDMGLGWCLKGGMQLRAQRWRRGGGCDGWTDGNDSYVGRRTPFGREVRKAHTNGILLGNSNRLMKRSGTTASPGNRAAVHKDRRCGNHRCVFFLAFSFCWAGNAAW